MAMQPSGIPRKQMRAPAPDFDQSTAEWLVPLIIGGAVTAGLTSLLTPATTTAMAAAGKTAEIGLAGQTAASVGGGIAQEGTARAMAGAPPKAAPSPQLRQLATKPLNPARRGGGGASKPRPQGKAKANPFTDAFRRGLHG